MLSLFILIIFYCARKPTPDTCIEGTMHMQMEHSVEHTTTGLEITLHLRSGRFGWRCMFHIKFTQYSYCYSCLQRNPQSGSSLMPPAKPRTRVPLSFSEPLLTGGAAGPRMLNEQTPPQSLFDKLGLSCFQILLNL